jgi:pimeloyl-ACP methyl ester carboxylesterase
MLDTQLVQYPNYHAADIIARSVGVRNSRKQQIESALVIAAVKRGKCLAEIGYARLGRVLGRPLKADPCGQPVGGEAARYAGQDRKRLVGLAPALQDAGQCHCGIGARGLELVGPPQRFLVAAFYESVGFRGKQRVEELLDRGWRLGAGELGRHPPVAKCLDRRDALNSERPSQTRVGVDVDLRELELSRPRGRAAFENWAELTAGTAPFGPEVDDDGERVRAVQNLGLKGSLGDVHVSHGSGAEQLANLTSTSSSSTEIATQHAGVKLAGEEAGNGIPIVLLHGLTATRRYVVMGSRALERSDHRVIAYDARGHGKSSPAPARDAYTYQDLGGDLLAVLDDEGIERAVLAGASMGAHTLLWLALNAPERAAGLVVITPAYDPAEQEDEARLARWDALAEGLERGGIDGFIAAQGRPDVPESWQETVEKVTRQRLSQHEHLDAVADALRAVPRSRPFGTVDELGAISVPTVVVASADGPDPGHPQAVGEAYAAAIPRARLVLDEPGKSPIAWQGSQLSKLIAELAAGVDAR